MFKRLKEKLLTVFGSIKVSKYPMWVSYSPTTYKAKGKQYREVVDLLKPGYVLGRGYDDYLDGYFIPGNYSHSGICARMGDNIETVIHSMSCGVFEQDLIDFLRCDRFVIFKPRKGLRNAVKIAHSLIGKKYDFDFVVGNNSYYCHEMVAKCYPDLDIKPVKTLFGKMAYTIDSFIQSPDFEIVYEFNDKLNRL